MFKLLIVAAFLAGANSRSVGLSDDLYAIPEGMLIGAGVSAMQTEGAWNVSGKGESAVDYVLHAGKLSAMGFGDPHEHDVAASSYYRYKEDIAMAAKLKLSLYRFSISWARVLPDADASRPNMAGVQYYHDLIDEIRKYNMTPMATLHHFDHPSLLERQFKGWQGEEMVAKFKEYARFAFNEYAGKVNYWVTVNEPNGYCIYFPMLFNLSGIYNDSDIQRYNCVRHTILAHAEAWHVFREDGHVGQVGFSALLTPARPNSTRSEDVYTADAYNELQGGLVLEPVVHGDWPQYVKDLGGSKVPPFSEAEKERIRGTADFIGFNVYYTVTAAYQEPTNTTYTGMGIILNDIPFANIVTASGESPALLFEAIEPESMRMAILWTWEKYGRPLVVTENGFGDAEHIGKNDELRAAYHSAYLRMLVKTVKEFDVDMIGYCAWSLIDCFEWSAGYNRPFGLVHVDYENGSLNRSLKDSSSFWIEMADTGVVPYVDVSSSTTAAPATSSPRTSSPRSSTPQSSTPMASTPGSSTPGTSSSSSASDASWLLAVALLSALF